MSNDKFEGLCLQTELPKRVKSSGGQLALFVNDKIWDPKSNGKITISFDEYYGCNNCTLEYAWSAIGTDTLYHTEPSMHLGWVDPPLNSFTIYGKTFNTFLNADRTEAKRSGCNPNCPSNYVGGQCVLHEFGHALGMYHEHQNYINNSSYTRFKSAREIYDIWKKDCSNRCEPWSIDKIQHNIVDKYSCDNKVNCEYSGSEYDPTSIMTYYVPENFLLNKEPQQINYTYSITDLKYLQTNYPIDNPNNFVNLEVIFINSDKSPEWKRYWVCYCVTNYLAPYVGINFTFKDRASNTTLGTTIGQPKKDYRTAFESSQTTQPPTRPPTQPPTQPPTRPPTQPPTRPPTRTNIPKSLRNINITNGSYKLISEKIFFKGCKDCLHIELSGNDKDKNINTWKSKEITVFGTELGITCNNVYYLSSNGILNSGSVIYRDGLFEIRKMNKVIINNAKVKITIKNKNPKNDAVLRYNATTGEYYSVGRIEIISTIFNQNDTVSGNINIDKGDIKLIENFNYHTSEESEESNEEIKITSLADLQNVDKWDLLSSEVGYPRPQGNLAMNPWGLTSEAVNELNYYYNGAYSLYK